MEIVGVVPDTVYGGLRAEIEPTIFLPIAQCGPVWSRFLGFVNLSVRSSRGRPELLATSVGAAIGSVNRDLALTFHPLTDYVNDSLVEERLIARLSGSFAALTLLLAALGLYGYVSMLSPAAGRRLASGSRSAPRGRASSGSHSGGCSCRWQPASSSALQSACGLRRLSPRCSMTSSRVILPLSAARSRSLPEWHWSRAGCRRAAPRRLIR